MVARRREEGIFLKVVIFMSDVNVAGYESTVTFLSKCQVNLTSLDVSGGNREVSGMSVISENLLPT